MFTYREARVAFMGAFLGFLAFQLADAYEAEGNAVRIVIMAVLLGGMLLSAFMARRETLEVAA